MKTCIFLFHALYTDVLYHFFLFDYSGIQTEVQYSALPRGIPCHSFNNGVTDKSSIFILRTKNKLEKYRYHMLAVPAPPRLFLCFRLHLLYA